MNHGIGKRWYLSARNYAKDPAFSEYAKGYTTSYFSRNVKPKSFEPEEITKHNKEEIFSTIKCTFIIKLLVLRKQWTF
ncbi:MAG: hypothetical protein ACFFDT_37000 [Candidatus Hodarchaeota archaeon]